ncbi:hypothetical protein AAG570_012259, partial [Ranatra chinensis]
SCHSNERLFLRDFVQCTAGTSGGRLSRWLQPDPYVDPSKCELLYSKEDMRCGWPAILTVLTKDQYGDVVHVPNLRAYENYSFEELRYTSPAVKRSSENMLVRPNSDGTYSATWTPASIGWYSIITNIDGYNMHEGYKVEVKEPPQGITPPTQSIVRKSTHQPNKLRKFVAKNSAGLRIRAHPSLQSEQIGIVHVNGTIAFIDEIHNDDGVWLRLNQDTIRQYCEGMYAEAWCLQFNQHLGKTLLLPVQEPKSVLDHVKETSVRKPPVATTEPL